MSSSTRTTQALEDISDVAVFEILAIRVLRLEEEDCRRIEHCGVSASGKTIKGPIDGSCLVPGSDPPRFIMVAITTHRREDLKRKWFFDHTQAPRATKATAAADGDVTKAARLAAAIRVDYPNGKFILHLCTNRRLDSEFMDFGYKEGTKRGIEIVFLGQSRIRDCLDTKPEGQWLRQEHLGIRAVLLSPSLLKDLSKESLERYGTEFLLTPPEHFVSTQTQKELERSLSVLNKALHVLTGSSGYGKSVVSYQILRKHVDSGGIGIRVPGEVITSSLSLEEAMETALKSICPTIENGCGTAALRLASPRRRLIIVVDDVNRSMRPTEIMKKVVAWTRPLKAGVDDQMSSSSWSVIMPAWEIYWAPLERESGPIGWANRLFVASMSQTDAVACLKSALGELTRSFTDTTLKTIASTLRHDPMLLAMFGEVYRCDPNQDPATLAINAMERFVRLAITETTAASEYVEGDIEDSLIAMAHSMLVHRDLYPKWSDVRSWLESYQVEVLRAMSTSGRICQVTTRSRASRFEFRHDRILEHFITEALCTMLQSPVDHSGVLEDPYYIKFLGATIAKTALPDHTIVWLRAHAPLALIASISHLRSEVNGSAPTVVENARGWFSEAWNNPGTPSAIISAACQLLEEAQSPFVLTITDSMRAHPNVTRARFANGEVIAGAVELSCHDEFWPGLGDSGFDRILERVVFHHGRAMIENCKKVLERSDLEERFTYGALSLAGYLCTEELTDSIRAAWDSARIKTAILTPALWAALRCGGEESARVLSPMMDTWSSLSEDHQGDALSARSRIAEDLRFALRRGIPDISLRYLIDIGSNNDQLRYVIAHALDDVDHPLAVRYLVTVVAKQAHDAGQAGSFSIWGMLLQSRWDASHYSGRQLSPESIEALRLLGQDSAAQDWVRSGAFTFWAKATDDLTSLQEVKANHSQFEEVIWRRALFGDTTVRNFVKSAIAKDKKWMRIVARIWCSEFLDDVDLALLALRDNTPDDFSGGVTNDHYMLADLLRDIPADQAERLLIRHWAHLQFSALFVQAALYIGSETTIAMVNEVIGGWPPPARAFRHLGNFFGFFVQGLSDRICMNHLEAVRPFLEHLDDHAIHDLIHYCDRSGLRTWIEQYLRPEVLRRKAEQERETEQEQPFIVSTARYEFPTDADLLRELDRMEHVELISGLVSFWCEGFERRQDPPERWRHLVRQWAPHCASLSRLRVAVQIIAQLGSRQDLNLIESYPLEALPETLDRLVAHMRFCVMRRTLQ